MSSTIEYRATLEAGQLTPHKVVLGSGSFEQVLRRFRTPASQKVNAVEVTVVPYWQPPSDRDYKWIVADPDLLCQQSRSATNKAIGSLILQCLANGVTVPLAGR